MNVTDMEMVSRLATCLPGVGEELVVRVQRQFGGPRGMFEATEEEWMEIPGIGKDKARLYRKLLNS
jgi:ERCC4-type nuclease